MIFFFGYRYSAISLYPPPLLITDKHVKAINNFQKSCFGIYWPKYHRSRIPALIFCEILESKLIPEKLFRFKELRPPRMRVKKLSIGGKTGRLFMRKKEIRDWGLNARKGPVTFQRSFWTNNSSYLLPPFRKVLQGPQQILTSTIRFRV